MEKTLTKTFIEKITFEVVGAAIEVHKQMGRGLLEGIYKCCMMEELKLRKLNFGHEKKIPVVYKGKELSTFFRCDLFVEDCLVVELKSVNDANPIFEAQLLSYMKLLQAPKGIIINFNVQNIFYKGQKNFVNEYFSKLPV